ncbi:MAG: YbhB/YbcL family Raf kinase inhibitor-like protein [Candidatus Cloacimonetes bacterium]|nr:YbhB/YbcL family Raf kinase inhibitor-like protein [Candidatus Cloacimonadota bacterium]
MVTKIASTAFAEGEMIPRKYTCDGDDISPPLQISDVPENTKSLALIMDDPDAPVGVWDHWIVFNIPASISQISEGEEPQGTPGKNSWGRTGYGGPCPPSGTHRYFFKLYALDTMLDLEPGASKKKVLKAMEGHILAQGELMGKYKR